MPEFINSNSPSSLWDFNEERKTLHFKSQLWNNCRFAIRSIDGIIASQSGEIERRFLVPNPTDLKCIKCYQKIELTSYVTIEGRLECSRPLPFLFAFSSFLVGLLKNFDGFLEIIIHGNKMEQQDLKLLDCAIEGLNKTSALEIKSLLRLIEFYKSHGSFGSFIDRKKSDGMSYREINQILTSIIGLEP